MDEEKVLHKINKIRDLVDELRDEVDDYVIALFDEIGDVKNELER